MGLRMNKLNKKKEGKKEGKDANAASPNRFGGVPREEQLSEKKKERKENCAAAQKAERSCTLQQGGAAPCWTAGCRFEAAEPSELERAEAESRSRLYCPLTQLGPTAL